jgi:hypothetical protein
MIRVFHLVKCVWFCLVVLFCGPVVGQDVPLGELSDTHDELVSLDGRAIKRVLDKSQAGENVLQADRWGGWQKGFRREGNLFVCDNGNDGQVQRGVSQRVELNQMQPEPFVASAWSKAEKVGGSRNSDYSLYLDLTYLDGTSLWGQVSHFNVGSHDWERREVLVFPEKPVKAVHFHMLLRRHTGKAWFRDPELRVLRPKHGACLFDGVAVSLEMNMGRGFQIRDVGAGSDFVRIERQALGLRLETQTSAQPGATFYNVTISDTTGKDRAVTLVYSIPVDREEVQWLHDLRREKAVQPGREYMNANRFGVGANGRLSRYPFGAVTKGGKGIGLGIDMGYPTFYRIGYNAGSGELFLAYDLGFTKEKPTAKLRFCAFDFDPIWKFRGALATYYKIFPDYFVCRTPEQGLWMPFAKISAVEGWQDFGFKFKEGTNETKWDDVQKIVTFNYTEPMTWWMRMPSEMPRTMEAAIREARRLAREKNDNRAKALFSSGYHDEQGQFVARLLDTPWCNGAVWSINSMPNVSGAVTDFKNCWNATIIEKRYGPNRNGDLDGEYIDSSEGYVTDELNFRRDHFSGAKTPLTFSPDSYRPAIFRGLIVFEYVRQVAEDVHGQGKLMMANSTPIRLCWLAPLLDVMGTETNWNPGGKWRPMSDTELLYRRALCKGKPFCFLMNTRFEDFSHERVETYMKRALAYGMFPGFFSHNASQGHYFSRPKLYNRDRVLFRKYVPICKRIAEAGWEPIPQARSSDAKVYVERFGEKYLTVFNDSSESRTATITLDGLKASTCRDLVGGTRYPWRNDRLRLTIGAEDVVVLELN